ncbi:MAG: histidinol dehydrogenase [Acidobacteria bacterium RIFCSPLOWO2_12_FULL_65_11]|nr:MAG: histidinol dehydrogenase [Acidobacteria bacterium RIFCSPLOWO2_02_FULL_64_15]OFW32685.1 MAG: histidinol dehydrogenase [Acidobacteria bacterium RIFCSPLOWO2_12_FULL_65_11]
MRIIASTDRAAVNRVLARRGHRDPAFERRVRRIVEGVRTSGDPALVDFARRFDHVEPPIEISIGDMRRQATRVPTDVRQAIGRAARAIARVASRQMPAHWELAVVPGVSVEQRVEPIERVGCYVPGGRFPLPSSLLMTAVPARVAGVGEIIAVCPRPDPVVMAAALEAGVTRLFRVGGAHAIAALAYGTKTIPRVDKIVGPGNKYVAAAKSLVAGDCAIDFYAGPTEIVIVAASGRPAWVAADIIAQAEHDPDARSILITWSRPFAERVARVVRAQSKGRTIVARSLAKHGAVIVTRSAGEAIALANRLAPEHLVLDRESLARQPLTAGAVFIGPYTAQAAGDYATGSNHVLPTSGAARFRGGLGAADFVRLMAVQRVTRPGLARLAATIVPLARAEGLIAHAESIEVRLRSGAPGPRAARPGARGPRST